MKPVHHIYFCHDGYICLFLLCSTKHVLCIHVTYVESMTGNVCSDYVLEVGRKIFLLLIAEWKQCFPDQEQKAR